MFGYVIPWKEKLTEEEWAVYRGTYCGLCHAMGQRYGFAARFLLNYDFTFLALLLNKGPVAPERNCRRCVSAPLKGRPACEGSSALDSAADISVLLVYWKLKDRWQDEKGLKKLSALLLLGLFYFPFRSARRRNPALNRSIGTHISNLSQLEQSGCTSIDRTADQFAQIMVAMVPAEWPEPEQRAMGQLLYHLGRWIYLIDAWDDLKDDLKHHRYNPVSLRYQLSLADLEQEKGARAGQDLERTLRHSENLAISAFYLDEFGYSAPIIENILCAGLPMVRQLVLSGQWKQRRRIQKQELKRI